MKHHPHTDDEGSVMLMTVVIVLFLMIGGFALISASQQWAARRDAYAVAAAAARAGAQGDPLALRGGNILNEDAARTRALAVLAAAGRTGTVTIDGPTITVNVAVPVDYLFAAPGFPSTVKGSATATARRGVTGLEGG